eukprot:gb/GECG01005560.1/.p1 GENE.gb/GECG01005560.1/~~gb/GECG01005560.1/.p1  ORF type:complete len:153 (+),score=8.53 gb/GECG01005560.1/:1-459(+)
MPGYFEPEAKKMLTFGLDTNLLFEPVIELVDFGFARKEVGRVGTSHLVCRVVNNTPARCCLCNVVRPGFSMTLFASVGGNCNTEDGNAFLSPSPLQALAEPVLMEVLLDVLEKELARDKVRRAGLTLLARPLEEEFFPEKTLLEDPALAGTC